MADAARVRVSVHRYRAPARPTPVLVATCLERSLRARGLPVWALRDVHCVGDELSPATVLSVAESLCYPWSGRAVCHPQRGADQAFEELARLQGATVGTASVRLQDGRLSVWLAASPRSPAQGIPRPAGPYVYAYSESARWVDAFGLQRGVWSRSEPDVLAVSGRAGVPRDAVQQLVTQLYLQADGREVPVPSRVEALVGQDAAACSLYVACSLGRPCLIVAVDQEMAASVAVGVSPEISGCLAGRKILAHTDSRHWERLQAIAGAAQIELAAIRRLVACTPQIATDTAKAGALNGWSPAIEIPACGRAMGTLAPLAAFTTAMSWACRDAPEPVMWLDDNYGAVVRVPSPTETP